MSEAKPPTLRERTRQAVQAEMTAAAQTLIVEKGYDAVTVDDITDLVGVSKRSFFRYFTSKEDVVLGQYDLFGDRLVEAIDSRPDDELLWDSLRRMFDNVVALHEDDARRATSRAIQAAVLATPALHAGYLERFDGMQGRVAERVRQRLAVQGFDLEPVVVRALVGSAFACLQAATRLPAGGGPSGIGATAALDDAMAALRPADPRLG